MSGTMRAYIRMTGGPRDGGTDVVMCDPWTGPPMRLFYWVTGETGKHVRIRPDSTNIPAGAHIYHKGQRDVKGTYNYHYVGEYGDSDKASGQNSPG